MNKESILIILGMIIVIGNLVIGVGSYPDSRDAPRVFLAFICLFVGIGIGILIGCVVLMKSDTAKQNTKRSSEK